MVFSVGLLSLRNLFWFPSSVLLFCWRPTSLAAHLLIRNLLLFGCSFSCLSLISASLPLPTHTLLHAPHPHLHTRICACTHARAHTRTSSIQSELHARIAHTILECLPHRPQSSPGSQGETRIGRGGQNKGRKADGKGGVFIHFYDHIDKVSGLARLLGNAATLSWIEL